MITYSELDLIDRALKAYMQAMIKKENNTNRSYGAYENSQILQAAQIRDKLHTSTNLKRIAKATENADVVGPCPLCPEQEFDE